MPYEPTEKLHMASSGLPRTLIQLLRTLQTITSWCLWNGIVLELVFSATQRGATQVLAPGDDEADDEDDYVQVPITP